MIAALMVNTMVSTAEALLDAGPDDPIAEAEVVRTAEKQLRLIALGIPQWRSGDDAADVAEPAPAKRPRRAAASRAPARAGASGSTRPAAATRRPRRSPSM